MIGGQWPLEFSGQTVTAQFQTVNYAACGNVADFPTTGCGTGKRSHSSGEALMPGKKEEEEKPWVPPSMTFKDGTKCFSERTMHY